MLSAPMPAISDPEGEKVPEFLPFIVDAHVHVFPDSIFPSIWQWFEQFGRPIRYRLKAQEVVDFLLNRGIGYVVALHYAHKPGIARNLNAYIAELCKHNRAVTGFATVFPGEEDAAGILRDALSRLEETNENIHGKWRPRQDRSIRWRARFERS